MTYKVLFITFFIILVNWKYVQSFDKPLVDVQWLSEHSCDSTVKVIAVSRSKSTYESSHIPCSVYTNFYSDGWRETRDGLPLQMPAPDILEKIIGSLGISRDHHVIIYSYGNDNYSVAETTAIFFTFAFLGHKMVSILDGGIDSYTNKWDADIETGHNFEENKTYFGKPNYSILATYEDVSQIIIDDGSLIDMRANDQYLGINKIDSVKEYGTLPNAKNLPVTWLIKDESANFHNRNSLKRILNYVGVDNSITNTLFCNAGLESSVGWFVLYALLGNLNTKLYDGSLVEWTKKSKLIPYQDYKHH